MTISATTQGLRMGVATSSSRPTVPFDGQVISETDTDSLKVYNGTAWIGVGYPIAVFNETQASGTNGGTSTSGSFLKRTLNTTVKNDISGCSIASSVITLPAGTFYVSARSPINQGGYQQARIRNTTDGTDLALSGSGYSPPSTSINVDLTIQGFFVLAASKTIELQYRVGTGISSGLGLAVAFGDEVFSSITIMKVA